MPTLNKQTCPTCGQSVNEREINMFKGMVVALFEVWKWCEEKDTDEFTRKDIKHLFKDENQIARFGDWVLFGMLERTDAKGHYKISMNRCRFFFAGDMAINTTAIKNPLTKEIRYTNPKKVTEIKGIGEFLDENDEYIVEYLGKSPLTSTR